MNQNSKKKTQKVQENQLQNKDKENNQATKESKRES